MQDDILAGLNPAQREAVTTIKGPVLVLAGPGSGKTRVLAHRVAYLLRVAGVHPRAIMGVTFTNKAAGEMRERINRLLGESVPTSAGWKGLTIGTFHSLCARILRAEAGPAGLNPNFVIYDDGEQLTAIKQALRDLKLDEKMYRPEAMRGAISKAKNELVKPEAFEASTYWAEVARRVYARYQEIMQANGALDFDDLLTRTTWLLQEQPEVLKRYQERYQYLLVDEFQDTNTAQYEMVHLLVQGHRNLFGVGDEDQSIFAFRGADYRNVMRFREDFPEAKVILLEQNYRSTQTILDAANAVITKNRFRTPKKLRTDRGSGLQVVVQEAYDESDEAAFVAGTIQRLLSQREAKLGDCAVMYRTNAQSRALEDAFVARGMPYRLVGGTRFYQRKEIKDALAYLRLVHNPADNIALGRVINVPPRHIGDKTIATLAAWSGDLGVSMVGGLALAAGDLKSPALSVEAWHAASPQMTSPQTKPPEHPFAAAAQKSLVAFYRVLASWIAAKDGLTVAALLDRIAEESGYATWLRDGTEEGEDRWSNLQELRTVAAHYDDFPPELRLTAFLEEVALVSDQDQLAEEADRVTLLTLHTAKGLEFPVVFIVGLEENILPHSRSLEDPDQMEEERRLMYVGVTRAKDRLYLVRAFRRMIWGRSEVYEPSRFLRDVKAAGVGVAGEQRGGAAGAGAQRSAAQGAGERWARQERDDTWELPKHRREEPRSAPFATRPRDETGRSASAKWAPGALGQTPTGKPASRSADRSGRQPQFKSGDRVDHGLFGQGIVLKAELTADDEEVTVAFAGKGTKTLLASFAKLRKIS